MLKLVNKVGLESKSSNSQFLYGGHLFLLSFLQGFFKSFKWAPRKVALIPCQGGSGLDGRVF